METNKRPRLTRLRARIRRFGPPVLFVGLALVFLAFCVTMLRDYLYAKSLRRFPLATGRVVERGYSRTWSGSRPLLKIRVDGSGDVVVARLAVDGIDGVPDAVSFHWPGTPGSEVHLEEEWSALWPGLLTLGGIPLLALVWYASLLGAASKRAAESSAGGPGQIAVPTWNQRLALPLLACMVYFSAVFLAVAVEQATRNLGFTIVFGALALLCAALAGCAGFLVPYRGITVSADADGLVVAGRSGEVRYRWSEIGGAGRRRFPGWLTVRDANGRVVFRLDCSRPDMQRLVSLLRGRGIVA